MDTAQKANMQENAKTSPQPYPRYYSKRVHPYFTESIKERHFEGKDLCLTHSYLDFFHVYFWGQILHPIHVRR